MAIDDLLAQSDPAQRAARAGTQARPPIDPDAAARLARMRAADGAAADAAIAGQTTVRGVPGVSQGIEGGIKSFGDGASTVARSGGAVSRVASLGRNLGLSALPTIATGSAIDSFSRPTEDYYNRFGMDPKTVGQNGFKDVAARAGGVISDLGAATLDAGLGPVNFVRQFAGAEPLQTFGSILRANDNPTQQQAQGIAARVQSPSPNKAPSLPRQTNLPNDPNNNGANSGGIDSGIYRKANSFSSQPLAGGTAYNGADRVSVLGNADDRAGTQTFLDQSAQQHNDARARQDQDLAASSQSENAIAARNLAENNARDAHIYANRYADFGPSARSDRETRAALLSAENNFKGQAIAAQQGIGTNPQFIRTPEQEQALRLNDQKAKTQNTLDTEQGIGAGLDNAAKRRQAAIQDEIQKIGPNTPSAVRDAIVDRALIAQGKDPNASRFESIESVGGNDAMPMKIRSLYDVRTGRMITGPGTSGAVGQQPQTPQAIPNAAINDLRANPKLKADFEAKYGAGAADQYLTK